MQFNFAINFGSELIDVRSGTSTLRLYSFQHRNYEEKLEKPKNLLFSTSNEKIRPSFKMKEATLMFSTSNGAWPKNQKITKIIFRKISKKRKRPTKKHKERRYTCSKSRIFDLFCLTSFVAKVLQYSKNLALLIRHFFNFTIYNKLFFIRLFLALLIVLSINEDETHYEHRLTIRVYNFLENFEKIAANYISTIFNKISQFSKNENHHNETHYQANCIQ